MRTLNRELQKTITPQKAVELLKEGNQRFLNNLKINRNLLQQVNETRSEQFPFAVIISCMDSRTSAELIFDQGLGDIFSIRVAGNVINEDIIGSAEYACKVVGAKIILVLGHTSCGAIRGAIDRVDLGHLRSVTTKIQRCFPKLEKNFKYSSTGDLMNLVTIENISAGIRDLRNTSPILSELEKSKELTILGGIYDVNTGKVTFVEGSDSNQLPSL